MIEPLTLTDEQLKQAWDRVRSAELAALRCENVLMRQALPPPNPSEQPRAIEVVDNNVMVVDTCVNGEAVTSLEAFTMVSTKRPDLNLSHGQVRGCLQNLVRSGKFVRTKRIGKRFKFERSKLYAKNCTPSAVAVSDRLPAGDP